MSNFKPTFLTKVSLLLAAAFIPVAMVLSMDDMTSPNTGKPVASYGIFNHEGKEIARPDIYFFFDVERAKEKPGFRFASIEDEHGYLEWRLRGTY